MKALRKPSIAAIPILCPQFDVEENYDTIHKVAKYLYWVITWHAILSFELYYSAFPQVSGGFYGQFPAGSS